MSRIGLAAAIAAAGLFGPRVQGGLPLAYVPNSMSNTVSEGVAVGLGSDCPVYLRCLGRELGTGAPLLAETVHAGSSRLGHGG